MVNMAATFAWTGNYGEDPGTVVSLGTSGNLFNFKRLNSLTGAADYTSYPITAGQNSYEVWLRGKWTGTFNAISNLQFWKSAPTAYDAGIAIKWSGAEETYVTPITGASTLATANVPTADPGTANVTIGGALTGELAASGYSDYVDLQMQTTTAAAAGDTSTYTFTLQYDEN